MSEPYEVLAVEYARATRPSRDFYVFPDPHDGPRPIAYYLWVIRNAARTIVVDTGFGPEAADRRKRGLRLRLVADRGRLFERPFGADRVAICLQIGDHVRPERNAVALVVRHAARLGLAGR